MFTPEHRANMSKASGSKSEIARLGRKLKPPMTLTEIAAAAGVSAATLSKAEKGTRGMPEAAADKIAALIPYPKSRWKWLT